MAVNFTGTFLMCKTAAKHMVRQGQAGKIINIASIGGKRPTAGMSAYGTSKAGVISLTQTLALELGPHKINVNAVCPGAVVTWGTLGKPIYQAMKQGLSEDKAQAKVYATDPLVRDHVKQTPLGRLGKPDEIANMVVFLASRQSDFITGQAINVDGGQLMVR